jgi:NitT/TauT family transport system substrate-binding protein
MAATLAVVCGLLIVGCSRQTATQTPEVLRLGVDAGAMEDAPIFVAEAKGFWKDEHLNVEIRPFASGRLALDALIGNGVDAATASDIPVVFAAYHKHPVRIITTFSDSARDISMLARRDRGILKPQDLRGKKIALPLGTAAEYVMDMFLNRNNIARSAVTVVGLQAPDTVPALIRGDVDAVFGWQPYIYNGQQRLGANAVVVTSEGIYSEPFNIIVLDSALTARAEFLTKLLRGLEKAVEFTKSNRQDAITIVAAKLGIEVKTADAIWDYYSFQSVLRPSLASSLRDEGVWAKQAGIEKPDATEPPYESLVSDAIQRRLR